MVDILDTDLCVCVCLCVRACGAMQFYSRTSLEDVRLCEVRPNVLEFIKRLSDRNTAESTVLCRV